MGEIQPSVATAPDQRSAYKEEFNKLVDKVKSVFLISDFGIIKLICAVIVANRMKTNPLWMFIAAPPASGKTEFITALEKIKGIYPVSTVTSQTFISGQKSKKGQETSLLFKIRETTNKPILTFKDFTTILSLHPDEVRSIFGQLREIYDGELTRIYGNGQLVTWKGKMGLLAGVTEIIHTKRETWSALGERFLTYSLIQPNPEESSLRAMDNTPHIQEDRDMLKDAFCRYLDDFLQIPEQPIMPEETVKREIIELCTLATAARTKVERAFGSSAREITFIHNKELPTRMSSQLVALANGFMVMNAGALEELDRKIIYKIALDCISSIKRKCLRELARYDWVETRGLAVKLNYPTTTIRFALEDLNALEMCDRSGTGTRSDQWRLRDKYRLTIARFDDIRYTKGEVLTEPEAITEQNKMLEAIHGSPDLFSEVQSDAEGEYYESLSASQE